MKYFRRNSIKSVRVIVENNDTEITSIFKEVLEEYNLEMSDKDNDLVIIVGNYTTFITGLNITDFNENSIYVGINPLNYEKLISLKKDVENFIKFICETKDLTIIKTPLIEVNISKKYGLLQKLKAINNIDILGKFKYKETIDQIFFQTCSSEGVKITSNLNSMLYDDEAISKVYYDDKRLVRTVLGYDWNKYIPFFANPIPCSNYKIVIEKMYENIILKIDNNQYKNVNAKDILYIEIEYINKFIEILYLDEKFLYMDLLKLNNIV